MSLSFIYPSIDFHSCLGIDPGVLWRVSDPEITKEAEACLGMFKVLLDGLS